METDARAHVTQPWPCKTHCVVTFCQLVFNISNKYSCIFITIVDIRSYLWIRKLLRGFNSSLLSTQSGCVWYLRARTTTAQTVFSSKKIRFRMDSLSAVPALLTPWPAGAFLTAEIYCHIMQ